jgi:hypothetical protein
VGCVNTERNGGVVKAKIDFYKVQMPEAARQTLRQVLAAVAAVPADQRTAEVFDTHLRLHEAATAVSSVEAEFIRIRMDAIPIKASLAGDVGALGLEDDEGIGEETACLFDTHLNVLVIQRNRYGASLSCILRYLEIKAGFTDGSIYVEPIILPDALARLAKMTVLRKFKIQVAGTNNLRAFQDVDAGLGQLVKLGQGFSAPVIELALSMGHKHGEMDGEGLKQFIRKVFRGFRNGNEITKLEVSGRSDDDASEAFDLLDSRMIELVELEPNEERRIPYAARRAAVHQAWRAKRAQLLTLFGEPGR